MPPLPLLTIETRLRVLVMSECFRHQSGSVKSGALYVCPSGVSPAPSAPWQRAQLFLNRSPTWVPDDLATDRFCGGVALVTVKSNRNSAEVNRIRPMMTNRITSCFIPRVHCSFFILLASGLVRERASRRSHCSSRNACAETDSPTTRRRDHL